MSENKGVKILSLDAKDIYNANNLVNRDGAGYSTRRLNGDVSTRRYINTFDYSLDMIKLQEIYYKLVRRKDWKFNIKGRNYCPHIINVTFKYSHKLYNQAGKDIYIKAGHILRDLSFNDNICLIGNEIIGIKLNVQIEMNQLENVSSEYFAYNAGKNIYEQIKNIPTIKNKRQLRDCLYENGFILDGARYIRFKRSSGSSRVGKCWFINEILYKRFHDWQLCGLKVKEGDPIDLAAFESYISLTSSSIIDTLQILPENVLVIDDYNSVFEDDVVAVRLKDGYLTSGTERVEISNSIWDGQSLLDTSLFGEYSSRGMLLLRNRFFKTCGFNTNIQQWFADNGISDVSQLNGQTRARSIEDIKIITTPNSIKYLKFGTLEQWFNNWDSTFGIVKYEKPPHYFDGRMVQCHYQLLNTLQLSYEDIGKFLQPSLDFISQVRNDPDILRYYIKYSYPDIETMEFSSKNDIVFGLLGVNRDFSRTKLYKDFRDDLVKAMVKNLKRGHVLVNGNYSVLFGNGLEMLNSSINRFTGESALGAGNIYSKRFEDGQMILGTRSPHITMANVYLATNRRNVDYDRYFNLSNEIVCINAIGENIQQRLNGADFDSDTMLLTDNELLINAAIRNYNKFPVPTSMVEAQKTQRHYTGGDKADLDVKTSVNKIGEIVNLSQELNSKLWDNVYRGQTIEQNMTLYYDICKLAVLSGIEIDKAKKEFAVDSVKEIRLLKEKYRRTDGGSKIEKPMFFKMITRENGYTLNPKHRYKYFHTSMDYLQKAVSKYSHESKQCDSCETIPLSELIEGSKYVGGGKYRRRDEIVKKVRYFKKSINEAYRGVGIYDNLAIDEQKETIRHLKEDCTDYLSSVLRKSGVVILLLQTLENAAYKDVKNLLFGAMFQSEGRFAIDMIKRDDEITKLVEDENGDILIFDYRFRRQIYKKEAKNGEN